MLPPFLSSFLAVHAPTFHKTHHSDFLSFFITLLPFIAASSVLSALYFQITSRLWLYTLSHSIPHHSEESQGEGRKRWWKSKGLRKRGMRQKKLKATKRNKIAKKKGESGGVTGQKLKTKKKGQEEELRSRIRKKKIKEEAEGERG